MRLLHLIGRWAFRGTVLVALLSQLWLSPAYAQQTWTLNSPYLPYWSWPFSDSNGEGMTGNPNLSVVPMYPSSASVGVKYQTGGRPDQALLVDSSTNGYKITYSPSPYNGQYVWMSFVWANSIGTNPQMILQNEGTNGAGQFVAGFSLSIDPNGYVDASVGRSGKWVAFLTSVHRIGPLAWHHVALAWDGRNMKLYLNGLLEAQTPYSFPPEWGQELMFGAHDNGKNSTYLLDGALDGVKLVNFTYQPIVGHDVIKEDILQHEFGIAFRTRFLQDLAAVYDPAIPRDPYNPDMPDLDRFRSPTVDATSEVRAAVNSAYTNSRESLPEDPKSECRPTNFLNCVYPAFGGPVVYQASATPPLYNSLYADVNWNIPGGTHPPTRTYCGGTTYILAEIYRALGYQPRMQTWVNGTDWSYTTAHTISEVYTDLSAQGLAPKYVMQDGLYNVSGILDLNGTVSYNSVPELVTQFKNPAYTPQVLKASSLGYSLNTDPIPSLNVTATGFDYTAYFNLPAELNSAIWW